MRAGRRLPFTYVDTSANNHPNLIYPRPLCTWPAHEGGGMADRDDQCVCGPGVDCTGRDPP